MFPASFVSLLVHPALACKCDVDVVVETAPPDGAEGVPTDVALRVTATYDLDGDAFVWVDAESGVVAAVTVVDTPSPGRASVLLRPDEVLEPQRRYEVSDGETTVSFTTGDGPEGTQPPHTEIAAAVQEGTDPFCCETLAFALHLDPRVAAGDIVEITQDGDGVGRPIDNFFVDGDPFVGWRSGQTASSLPSGQPITLQARRWSASGAPGELSAPFVIDVPDYEGACGCTGVPPGRRALIGLLPGAALARIRRRRPPGPARSPR